MKRGIIHLYKIGILFENREFEHDVYELIKAFYPEAEIHTLYEDEEAEYDLRFRVERDNDSYLIRYERDENNGVISAAVIRDEKIRDSHKLRKENKEEEKENNFLFDIKPYSYQKEILERLDAERKLFNKNKNLVIAATGVGKTVISAFDYKNYCKENKGQVNRLLFVVHREEILKQARDTFRAILKNNNFGKVINSYLGI